MFCPHCGNSTLEKVEAVIGPDGTEQYGVRKRFNTRGTRYSLPKPKVCFCTAQLNHAVGSRHDCMAAAFFASSNTLQVMLIIAGWCLLFEVPFEVLVQAVVTTGMQFEQPVSIECHYCFWHLHHCKTLAASCLTIAEVKLQQ